ncbi:TPA: transposase [Vibrio vulnificus]|uniref:IS66 family transposase n=1 Tax=Vibrio vulnificus TaxID=672 RepID=UPI000691D033|nr:transposase [Vibrio vulnificus]EHY1015553.1 transposase [Vibrio vulnificus]EHY1123159.1 transposase [Vibrio vulnificus]HDY7473855.1 transposase [Vibrio vulnificus]HDY7818724.1 transposase [Vibrio vulnificus]HDY8229550.1 transposase [Vibrio vulnificus]
MPKKQIWSHLNQLSKLPRIIEDGRLSVENNRAERSVHPFTVGRNNRLFSNTHKSARTITILYSLIETAKANSCESYEHVRQEIHKLKYRDDYRHLLPCNMAQAE